MKSLLPLSIATSLLFLVLTSERNKGDKQDEYVCMPCGSDCDSEVHSGPGVCSHCNMALVKKSTIKQKNVEPGDLCSFITRSGNENVLLLDVRTVAEFEGKSNDKFGRLANAVNIPIQELDKRMGELSAWKDRPIVVYCSHSHRSPRASYMLSQNGFKNVTNMLGGMSVWKESVKDKDCNQKLFISQ
jgi:rhodanese-related sulfurtransferase/DNA-directed RNA polymerase subunit RPC12/RpoP